jgi:hypothetical protein
MTEYGSPLGGLAPGAALAPRPRMGLLRLSVALRVALQAK